MSFRLQEIVARKLNDLGMSCEILAFVTGVHPSQISRWMRSTLELPGEKTLLLDRTLDEFEALATIARPFALPVRDAVRMRELLKKLRAGELEQPRPAAEIEEPEQERQ